MLDCSNFSNSTTSAGKYDVTVSCALFDFVAYTVVGGALCGLGCLGNIAAFMTLFRDKGRNATTFLLQSMAVADTLVLFVAVPLYVLPVVYPYTHLLRGYYELYNHLIAYLWPCYLMAYTGTILLTVLVSLQRYFAVCKPFKSNSFCSLERIQLYVLAVALFSVLYNIPRFFEYGKVTTCVGVNQTKDAFGVSAFGMNRVYRILYANILYFVIMHGGPLLTLSFLNAKLIMALKRRQRRRSDMGKAAGSGSGGGYQQDITLVLVVVICVFMCCQTPTFVDHVLWTFVDERFRQCGHWHYYYTAIGDLLAILNSSVNFIIYVITSKRFRDMLLAPCRKTSPEFFRLQQSAADGTLFQNNNIQN